MVNFVVFSVVVFVKSVFVIGLVLFECCESFDFVWGN